mmetsp:Transcript_20138/g.41743  ORF Transcript_20138/g.41743 Transcript_20138/m.41743 type:complete len:224 (-) Transcript_20138:177-848(-)
MIQIVLEALPQGLVGGFQDPVGVVVHKVAQPVGDVGLQKVFLRRFHGPQEGVPIHVLVDGHVEKVEKRQRLSQGFPEDGHGEKGNPLGLGVLPPVVEDRGRLDERGVHRGRELDVEVVKDRDLLVLDHRDRVFDVLVGHVLTVVDKEDRFFRVVPVFVVFREFLLELVLQLDHEFRYGRSTRLVQVKVDKDSPVGKIWEIRLEVSLARRGVAGRGVCGTRRRR